MHQPGPVRRVKSSRALLQEAEAPVGRHLVVTQQLLQCDAVDQLHHEIESAIRLSEVVDGDDVRMRETSLEVCLTAKAVAKLLVAGEACRQDLDGDMPLK